MQRPDSHSPVLVEIRGAVDRDGLVSLELFEQGASGVEEQPGGVLRAGFPSRAEAVQALTSPALPPGLEWHVVERDRRGPDPDAQRWRKSWSGREVGERFAVVPPWSTDRARYGGRTVLEVEPGTAFGAGTHESTALALAALEPLVKERDVILDVGTGTGILAIGAACLGAGTVVAIDVDPGAAVVARSNAARNGVGDAVSPACGEPRCIRRPRGGFHGVVANLLLGEHLAVAASLAGLTPDWAVLSGVLEGQVPALRAAWTDYDVLGQATAGRWVCLTLAAG